MVIVLNSASSNVHSGACGNSLWDADVFVERLGVLGERVRVLRKAHGWSQHDLAFRTGFGRPSLSGIEGGKQNITLEVLWRLASALQVHWADLLDNREADIPGPPADSAPFTAQLKAFGTQVYETRVLQRLSQQALTARTGIDRSAISVIELGTQNVTVETLSRLAVGLDVSWADLLDDRHRTAPLIAPAGNDSQAGPTSAEERQREPDFQYAATTLVDVVDRHDRPHLAGLGNLELYQHLFARRLLADYLDRVWHESNEGGVGEQTGVAALRHLVHQLLAAARNERMRRALDSPQQTSTSNGL